MIEGSELKLNVQYSSKMPLEWADVKELIYHHILIHLKPDLVGIHTNPVLIPHVLSRAQPCHGHCKLQFNKKKMQTIRTMNSENNTENSFCLVNCEWCKPCQNKQSSEIQRQTFKLFLNNEL